MAYIISSDSTPTNISKIAENDAAKDKLYLSPLNVVHTISDSDFANLKNSTKVVSGYESDNFVYTDSNTHWDTEEELTSYINNKITFLSNTLERYPEHSDASAWTTYKNVLENFDTSTVPYPLNTSWEKYCEDSSIVYVNLLQLP